ncbi:MAG: DUF975 family protein [Oscillospiraceae bacterium]|nr:DUF975 family protein [Oscillospiraceae bacterium]
MDRKLLKANAKQQLGGGIFKTNWLNGLLVFLIFMGISFVGGITGIGSIAVIVIMGPISFGMAKIFLGLVMGAQSIEINDMFSGFKTDFGGTFLIGLMTTIFTFLWSLLFVIPGIIKSIAYSMAYFVKVDHPEYDWKQCMDESVSITNGHKGELFVLQLSFIGWMIVCGFTFGIGYLWLMPYMMSTYANAYAYLTANRVIG